MPDSAQGRKARRLAAYGESPPGLQAWWYSRGRRRLAALGGRIAGVTQLEPVPFTPTPVDESTATTWVVEQAAGLGHGAIDEALGYALDNVINARTDQWVAQVQSEFAQHMARLQYAHNSADAGVSQETRLQPPDTHRVVETETARNAAALRLRGEHEKPAWPEPGHADPTLLAGRFLGGSVYVLALLVAAAADIAAFYQVIELVMRSLTPALVVILVIGFTGTALALSHFIGTMLRDRRAGAKWIQTFMIVTAGVIWIALGGLAFLVRLRSNGGSSGSSSYNASVIPGQSSSTSGSIGQGTLPGAALFAGLYAATGAVALIGGYLSHNPLRAAFARAVRAHRRAAEGQAISARRLRLAEAEREFYTDQITAAERVRDEAVQARLALSAELKQRARLEFAKHLRNASATDAFLDSDARPYTYRPFPN